MSATDGLALGISIGLGLLSIGISGFAIWLSFQFNDRSKDALDTVQDLTREIKTSVEVGLSQQQDMSGKMLDSIIDQNKYGDAGVEEVKEERGRIEDLIDQRLSQTESKIMREVEDAFSEFANDGGDQRKLNEALNSVRKDFDELKATVSDARSGFVTPRMLRNVLIQYKSHPAHYVLIAAIIRKGAQTAEELEEARYDYWFPGHWINGVKNLLKGGILVGDLDKFKVPDEFEEPLRKWVDLNTSVIQKLSDYYKRQDSHGELEAMPGVSDQELEIASQITL